MRLFVAVELPEAVHDAIGRGLGTLRRGLPPSRWVRREGMHVTLRFLGEQPEELVAELEERLKPRLATLAPVTVSLGGGGFFPHERRPRVAWLGGRAPGLETWAAAVEEAAVACGVPAEARSFSLHITLARIERPWGGRAVDDFLHALGRWQLEPFEARELVLFSSLLQPGGAVYEALRRLPVGGAA
jgi:2'-5' RNA ligase